MLKFSRVWGLALVFFVMACGDGTAPSNAEVCEDVAAAACDAAQRCGDIGPGQPYETFGQCLVVTSGLCCVTAENCGEPTEASADEVDACVEAWLFQECSASGPPAECSSSISPIF